MKKKILFFLQHADGIWSVPLAFTVFWLVGVIFSAVFGMAVGTYDMAFIQPLFLSAGVVIGATNIAVLGLYFTFRGLYRYLYGQQDADGRWVNFSKIDWKKLTQWQRYLIAFGFFLVFFSAIIIVYLKFV